MSRSFPKTCDDNIFVDHFSPKANLLKKLHRTMVRIRYFEEKVAELVEEKKVTTPCHLYIGQEAVAAGACGPLRNSDTIWGTHRSHGHYLAKGGEMNAAMAEIFCKQTGCSGGRGGSMHLCDPEVGIPGTSAIVAGSVPIGVGAALAEFIRGGNGVSLIFHGDGATEEGSFHEAVNFASLHKLPVVFICENNQYCSHLHISRRRIKHDLHEFFSAYGIRVGAVDGNDVMKVFASVSEAVTDARRGDGPWFIECKTYRWRGHVGPNWDVEKGLRSQQEINEWISRCPIKTLEQNLTSAGVVGDIELKKTHEDARKEVNEAVLFAENSMYPSSSDVSEMVYCCEENS